MRLLHAGLDIGSTTAKAVVLDSDDRIIFSRYIYATSQIFTSTKGF